MSKQCDLAMLQAYAASNARSRCTDGRTDLRRTTHLSNYLALGNARRGAAKNV